MKFTTGVLTSPWFFVPTSILVMVGATICYVAYGVLQESRMASMSLFTAILQRAIIDQDPNNNSLSLITDQVKYNQAVTQISSISHVDFIDWPGDCSLHLDLSELNPLQVPGSIQIDADLSNPKVIVFFYGPVPDLSPYLDLANQDILLSPRPKNLSELSLKQFESLTWVEVNDQRPQLKAITNDGLKSINWRGRQCGTYSYVIFEGAPS